MENNVKGVSNLELERTDGFVSQIIPEERYERNVAVDKNGKPTGKVTLTYENKFTLKEVNEGAGMVGKDQEGKAVIYQQVKHVVVQWDADKIREKRGKEAFRRVVSNLKKYTGLVTKDTKGQGITVPDEDKIGLGDVIRWREGELDRLPGVRFAYSELDAECKDKVHNQVIVPLEKKFNKAPKFSKADSDKLTRGMLEKLAEAGVITTASIEEAAKLIGVKPIEEAKEEK